MATATDIGWTRWSINPGIFGCEADGKECRLCYAEIMALRQEYMARARGETSGGYIGAASKVGGRAKWTRTVRVEHDRVKPAFAALPRTPGAVFVTSMADMGHEDVPDDFLELCFVEMEARPLHWFQVLTKRAGRLARFLRASGRAGRLAPNIWIGVTAGDPARAPARLDELAEVGASNLFVSMEPLLGRIDPRPWLGRELAGGGRVRWVIFGGETGHGAVPTHPQWFRDVRAACRETGTTGFFKQWGSWEPAPVPDLGEHNRGRQVCFRPDGHHQWVPSVRPFETMRRVRKVNPLPLLDGRPQLDFPPGWTP